MSVETPTASAPARRCDAESDRTPTVSSSGIQSEYPTVPVSRAVTLSRRLAARPLPRSLDARLLGHLLICISAFRLSGYRLARECVTVVTAHQQTAPGSPGRDCISICSTVLPLPRRCWPEVFSWRAPEPAQEVGPPASADSFSYTASRHCATQWATLIASLIGSTVVLLRRTA